MLLISLRLNYNKVIHRPPECQPNFSLKTFKFKPESEGGQLDPDYPRDIAVRCTFMVSFKSQSINPSVAGQVFGCAAPGALK